LAYYLQLKCNFKLSAFFGALSIVYRQTNVIWLGFCLCQLILLNAENLVKNQDIKLLNKQVKETQLPNIGAISQQQRFKRHSILFELLVRKPSVLFSKDFSVRSLPHKLYREDFWGKKLIYSDLLKILDMTIIQPYFLVITTFLVFVLINNGIVVGDRSNHQASFHFVQIFYFMSFSCFFNFSSFLFNFKKLKNLFNFLSVNYKIVLCVILPLCLVLVTNFTYEHPFLLADNRHYTFYLWSRLFKRYEMFKFLVVPIYVACGYLLFRNLTLAGKSLGWLVAFSACVLIGLVPQKLIEFRYFIIPFYIYRLNIIQFTWKELIAEFLFFGAINSLTLSIFVNRIFYWPNEPTDPQRFMW
jgi:alpha-1,2-glucosyltransferase